MPTAQELVKSGFYGYAGWDDAAADADYKATGGAGKGAATSQPTTNTVSIPSPQYSNQSYGSQYSFGQPVQSSQPSSAQDLVRLGFYGYQGWGDAEALADYKATGGSGKGQIGGQSNIGGGITDFGGAFNASTSINLPNIYKELFAFSGISNLETNLIGLEKQFLEQKAKISDNPFSSASMIDQRLQRLQRKYEQETSPIRNEIAMKKADIETNLNLQTRQFDINSQQAKQSLDYFNTLLSSGALDNASGEDIANLTRATGLNSSLIMSAVNANKQKNVTTSTISYDDGSNQGFVIINDKTGEIINRQVVSKSKPQQSTATERQTSDSQQTTSNLVGDIKRGVILRDLVGHYSQPGGLSVEEIYRLYNTYSPYGAALESIEQVKEGRFAG